MILISRKLAVSVVDQRVGECWVLTFPSWVETPGCYGCWKLRRLWSNTGLVRKVHLATLLCQSTPPASPLQNFLYLLVMKTDTWAACANIIFNRSLTLPRNNEVSPWQMRSHGTHMLPRSRPQQSFQSCKLEIRHPIVPNFQCFLPCTLPGSEGLLWFDIVIVVNHTA